MATSVASATDTYAERVGERADSLAPAERRVAELLLELGPEATLLSAAALAEQLGTSDATVVRTALPVLDIPRIWTQASTRSRKGSTQRG